MRRRRLSCSAGISGARSSRCPSCTFSEVTRSAGSFRANRCSAARLCTSVAGGLSAARTGGAYTPRYASRRAHKTPPAPLLLGSGLTLGEFLRLVHDANADGLLGGRRQGVDVLERILH